MSFRIYLTVDEAMAIHQSLIEEFGGHHGIRDKGLLESALFRPRSGYYESLVEEAAALMESLANNHAFIDGNKRISFVLTDVFLRVNGYFLDVEPQSAYAFIAEAMEKKKFRFPQIRNWISAIGKPLND
jgi:death on curing protein